VNIFYLSDNPVEAAQMQCDKHVPKMIVESGQMLSTAHRMLDGILIKKPSKSGKRMVNYWQHNDAYLEEHLYKAVHHNHPSTLWTRESAGNYDWHYAHFIALCDEYTYRFGKVHETRTKLETILKQRPVNIPDVGQQPIRRAMKVFPDLMALPSAVDAYRQFYLRDKADFALWQKGRAAPQWWTEAYA